MVNKNVSEAALTLLTSFQEANRAVAEHFMSAQERHRKLAERFFTEGMEVLKANQEVALPRLNKERFHGRQECLGGSALAAGRLSESVRDGGDPHAAGSRADAAGSRTGVAGYTPGA